MKKITIALDVEREVLININAMVDLEERFDVPLGVLFNPERVGIGLIRGMLTIALRHGGMKIVGRDVKAQEEQIGDLIQDHWLSKNKSLDDLMKIMMDAFNEAGLLPKEDEEQNQNPT